MLTADNVSFAYERDLQVLHAVSLAASSDDVVGILGPNGSGKTTLLKVLAGILPVDSGEIALDGRALRAWPRAALARRMSVVPQETHLAFDYSVLEIVLMGRYSHLAAFELEGPEDFAAARRAMTATGTAVLEMRPFASLSGGEKQRVIIASALAQLDRGDVAPAVDGNGASYLLLDEPSSSLDLGFQLELVALLKQLQRDRHLGIVVSIHDLNIAAALCTRMVMMREGRVLAAGPTRDVLTQANVRTLYGVEAEITPHGSAGHLVIVPIRRVASEPRA